MSFQLKAGYCWIGTEKGIVRFDRKNFKVYDNKNIEGSISERIAYSAQDDEDRENEGDFITAARNATPEIINFMATHGRGLICAPLEEDRCVELQLDLMVNSNS